MRRLQIFFLFILLSFTFIQNMKMGNARHYSLLAEGLMRREMDIREQQKMIADTIKG